MRRVILLLAAVFTIIVAAAIVVDASSAAVDAAVATTIGAPSATTTPAPFHGTFKTPPTAGFLASIFGSIGVGIVVALVFHYLLAHKVAASYVPVSTSTSVNAEGVEPMDNTGSTAHF